MNEAKKLAKDIGRIEREIERKKGRFLSRSTVSDFVRLRVRARVYWVEMLLVLFLVPFLYFLQIKPPLPQGRGEEMIVLFFVIWLVPAGVLLFFWIRTERILSVFYRTTTKTFEELRTFVEQKDTTPEDRQTAMCHIDKALADKNAGKFFGEGATDFEMTQNRNRMWFGSLPLLVYSSSSLLFPWEWGWMTLFRIFPLACGLVLLGICIRSWKRTAPLMSLFEKTTVQSYEELLAYLIDLERGEWKGGFDEK